MTYLDFVHLFCQYDAFVVYDGHHAPFDHLEVDLQDRGSVMDVLFFPYFSHFSSSCPIYIYIPFVDLVVLFMQQLSYHTDISLSPLLHD